MKLRGEWWIEDHSVMFADGDVGDKNHMAHVLEHVGHEFLEALRELPKLRGLAQELKFLEDSYDYAVLSETIFNWFSAECDEGHFPEEIREDPYTYLRDQVNWDTEKIAILLSSEVDGDRDPRNYAIKHLGWIKVKGNTAACRTLDHTTLRRISRGFDEILEQETVSSADVLLDITTHSDGVLYEDVPLPLIDGGELETIIRYHRRGASTDTTIQPGPEPIA
jgi:hypothetical protein